MSADVASETPRWALWGRQVSWPSILIGGLAVAAVVLVAVAAAVDQMPAAAAIAGAGLVLVLSWFAPSVMRRVALAGLVVAMMAGALTVARPDEYNWFAYAALMSWVVLTAGIARVGRLAPATLFFVWWVANAAIFAAAGESSDTGWITALIVPLAALAFYLLGAGAGKVDAQRMVVMLLVFAAVESVLALSQSLAGWPLLFSQEMRSAERNPLGYILPGVSRSVTPGMGTFSHFNGLGALLALCVPLAFGFWLASRRSVWRAGLLLLLLAGLWTTYSRAAWVGASLGLLLVVFVGGTRDRRLQVGVVTLTAMALVLVVPAVPAYYHESGNVGVRVSTWRVALTAASEQPENLVLGFGYRFFNREALGRPEVLTERMASLHSWFLQVTLELGLVGLILLLLLVVPRLAGGLRRSRGALERAITAALVAFFVSQLLDNSLLNQVGVFAFMLLGILSGLQADAFGGTGRRLSVVVPARRSLRVRGQRSRRARQAPALPRSEQTLPPAAAPPAGRLSWLAPPDEREPGATAGPGCGLPADDRNTGATHVGGPHGAGDAFHLVVAGPAVAGPLAAFLDAQTDWLPSGRTYTPVVPLVVDLLARGQRTTLVTLDESVASAYAASGPQLEILWGPYRRRHRMRDLMRAERTAVRKAVLHARPDLVHAHWCYEYALGGLDSGVPTLVTVRDWIPAILRMMPTRARPYWTGRALMYFLTLARARYLTANSPYTAAKVRPYTRGALEVVPNGIPDADFAAGDGDRRDRVAVARPIIVSVNNGFSPHKNVGALLRACQALRRGGLAVELRLVGSGYGPAEACSAWSRQQGLDEGVTFVGALSHDAVRRTMREATVLAHPAREESFGTTLIEAMAQRLPVVAGAHSGAVPWVLDGGRAGLLADITDPRALAAALRAVITQPHLHAQFAAEGYAHAWRCFRQSHVTDLYQEAYRRVLAEEARG